MIETFELRSDSNQGCACMHTWTNVRTRLGSNLGACECPDDARFELRPRSDTHTKRATPRVTIALAATHPTAVSLEPLRSPGERGRQRGDGEGYPLPGPT